MIEYYLGLDASKMTDGQMVMKIAHIIRIRKMEQEQSLSQQLQLLLGGK